MKKEQSSHKWTSDETNLFCENLADPMNSFVEKLEKRALENYLYIKYLIPLLLNLKKAWKMRSSKKNSKLWSKKERNQMDGWNETFTN